MSKRATRKLTAKTETSAEDSRQEPIIHQAVPADPPKSSTTLNGAQQQAVAVIALVILVASLLYFLWYKPNQPNAALGKALLHTIQAETIQYDARLDVNDFHVTVTGSSKISGAYDANATFGNARGTLQVVLRSVDGKTSYLKASGLANLGALLGSNADQYGLVAGSGLQSLDNQWLVIDKSSQDKLLSTGQVAPSGQLSVKDRQKFIELYQQNQFIGVKQVLSDETVGGQPSHRYVAQIDKPALDNLVTAIQRQIPSLKLTTQQVQSITQASAPKQNIDIWVSKRSGYVTQIELNDLKLTSSTKTASKPGHLRVTFTKYNQPVNVQAPSGGLPIFQALSQALAGGTNASTQQ